MNTLASIKTKAIEAVKNDGRLIADVAAEFGISRRKLYQWLSAKKTQLSSPVTARNVVGAETLALKAQLKLLQTEVQLLKSRLSQYQITETLENGRIKLDFQQVSSTNVPIKKAG